MKCLNYPYTEPMTPIGSSTEWSSSNYRGPGKIIFQPPTWEYDEEGSENYLRRIGLDMPTEVRKQLFLEQQVVIDNFTKGGVPVSIGVGDQYNYLSWETVAMDALARAPANTKPIWDAIDGITVGYRNQDFGTDPDDIDILNDPDVQKLLAMEVANQQQFIWDSFGPLVMSKMQSRGKYAMGRGPNMHPNFEKLVSPYVRHANLEDKQTENRLSGNVELSAYNLNVDMVQHRHALSGGGGGSYINLK